MIKPCHEVLIDVLLNRIEGRLTLGNIKFDDTYKLGSLMELITLGGGQQSGRAKISEMPT